MFLQSVGCDTKEANEKKVELRLTYLSFQVPSTSRWALRLLLRTSSSTTYRPTRTLLAVSRLTSLPRVPERTPRRKVIVFLLLVLRLRSPTTWLRQDRRLLRCFEPSRCIVRLSSRSRDGNHNRECRRLGREKRQSFFLLSFLRIGRWTPLTLVFRSITQQLTTSRTRSWDFTPVERS